MPVTFLTGPRRWPPPGHAWPGHEPHCPRCDKPIHNGDHYTFIGTCFLTPYHEACTTEEDKTW